MAKALENQRIEVPDRRSRGDLIRFEPSPRRVRAVFAGTTIAYSRRVMLMLESKYIPVYYFPIEDVRMDVFAATGKKAHSPYKGEASYWTIQVGDRVAENAAWGYLDPPSEWAGLKGYVAFYWDKMDAWYEEDDEVFVHARDPYKRVDVLQSSRHVQVVVGGTVVADTQRPRLLFETGLLTRYYIPKLDVRMDLLIPTETRTRCPYKGEAIYWSVKLGDVVVKDLVWSYPAPIPECPKIENLLCFFNERVDAIYVDGERQPVPQTPWSRATAAY